MFLGFAKKERNVSDKQRGKKNQHYDNVPSS